MSYLLKQLKDAANLLREKQYDDAENIYNEILHSVPSFPDAYYGLYKVYFLRDAKNYEEYFEKALFNLSLTIGYKEHDKEIFTKWLDEYKQVIGKNLFIEPVKYPFSKKLEIGIEKLIKKAKYQRAYDELKIIAKKHGLSKKMIYQLMVVMDKTNNIEEASVTAYSVGMHLPDDYEAWVKMAAVFIRSSYSYAAVKSYLRAYNINQKQHTPVHNLGALALDMDNVPAAKVYFYKAMENKPDFLGSRISLVDCLSDDAYYTTAFKILEKGREYHEDIDIQAFSFYYASFFYENIKNILSFKQKVDTSKYKATFLVSEVLFGKKEDIANSIQEFKKGFKDTKTIKIKDEVLDKRMLNFNKSITLMPFGRSGSLFFHSLFDGASDVATIPGVYFKGFFGNGVWQRLYNPKSKNWKKGMVERFLRMYEAIFDASSPAPVPGDPMSGKTGIGKNCGLTNMGEEQSISLKVDKNRFKNILLKLLDSYKEISQKDFFKLIHLAWEDIKGDTKDKKLLFYHIHNPGLTEYIKYTKIFDENKDLFIIRNPIKAAESWMFTQMPGDEQLDALSKMSKQQKNNALRHILVKSYGRLHAMLIFSLNHIASTDDDKLYGVRLEDIKEKPESMMRKLADFSGIEYDENLLKSEFMGHKYFGPKSKLHKNMHGFEKDNIKRGYVLFSEEDLKHIEVIFYPWSKVFGYTTRDAPTKQEIEDALTYNGSLFDFERRFLDVMEVDEKDIDMEVLGKRKRIFQYILTNLTSIEENLQSIQIIEKG